MLRKIIEQHEEAPIDDDHFERTMQSLIDRYQKPEYSFGIYEIGGGYQLLSKPEYEHLVSCFVSEHSKSKLSRGMLEGLAIIAYRQPTTRQEVERIRGVHSGYVLERLLERELIAITGRNNSPGQPLLYSITDRCLDFFGISSVKDLPKLEEHMSDDTPSKSS